MKKSTSKTKSRRLVPEPPQSIELVVPECHRGVIRKPHVIISTAFVPHGYQVDCHLNGQPLTVQCRDFGGSYEESALAALFIDMATDMVERFRQAVDHGALDNKDTSGHFSYPSDTAMLNWLEQQGSAQLGWKVQTPGDYPNVRGCVFACRNTTGGHKTLREAVAARMGLDSPKV